MKKYSFLLIFLPLLAQGTTSSLTQEECRARAVANNYRIRSAQTSVEAARETRREAFTKYFPEAAATGFAFKTNRNMVDFGLLDIIQVSFLNKGHAAGLQFVQPVFMGGQIYNGNKLAEVGVAVAELQRVQAKDDVIKTTDKYFWQVAALEAKLSTLHSVLHSIDSLQADVQAAYDAGIVTLNDVLEVNLKRNQFRADSVDLINGISLSKMLLGQYIGADTTEINIIYSIPDTVPGIPYDMYRIPAAALEETPQYAMLKKAVEARDLERRIALGKNLPQVMVGGGLYYYDAMDLDRSFAAGFVGVNIPLTGWWGGSHAMKKADLEKLNAQLQLENDSQMLQIEMRNAWDDVTAAQRKAQLAHESITQAAENMRIYQAFYDAGTTTITDLLQARTLYRQSCDSFTEAYAMYQASLTNYLVTTAQIPVQ